ncbi:D-2-hydroxyacid dehydrogenase [Halobacteriales archaeon QS_1_68_20]|nr:MAG: D-2-hydroxyacid dehydrogenase [Halobacteriales archaeon QS_1_68_20]
MDEPAVLHTVQEWLGEDLAAELEGRVPVRVATTPEQSRDLLADAEVAITGRLPGKLVDAAGGLTWLQAISAGVDHLALDELVERGVAVTNAAGVHAQPAAEQVFGYLLTVERGLDEAVDNQRRGVWERYSPGELAGKTLGVVGLGAIGSRVAEVGQAFGLEVVGTKRDPSDAPDAVDEVYGPDDLRPVLTRSDYLVLACPLTEETRGLIGRGELRAMDGDAVLVNVARGAVIDQDALVRALQYRWIRAAALDVFEEEPLPPESPLWDLSNAFVTPHVAGSTPRYAERLADIIAENYAAYRERGVEALQNRVR